MRPFRYYLRVRYSECDAQKVVFNGRYGEYVDLAVTEYMRAIGLTSGGLFVEFDYQLVKQTIEDCLTEAMDIEGLEEVLRRIEQGEIRCIARDLPEPSPLASEILNARPYAFLDNAPLEERRTQAVYTRRSTEARSAPA